MTDSRIAVREIVGEAVNEMQSIIITEEPTSYLGGTEERNKWGRGINSCVLILSLEGVYSLPVFILFTTTTSTFQSTPPPLVSTHLSFKENVWWWSGWI